MRRVIAAAFLTLIADPALATTVIPKSDAALVRDAGLILEGRVSDVRSEWAAGGAQIHTLVTISVDRIVKNTGAATPSSVTLRVLGGTVGDLTLAIIASPRYTPDEEVLLMLRPDWERTLHPVVGFNQGKFRIVTDAQTGRRMIQGRGETRDAFVSRIRGMVGAP